MEMSKNNEAYAISDRCGLDAGLERPVTHPPGEMCPSLGYSFTFRGSSRMALFTAKIQDHKMKVTPMVAPPQHTHTHTHTLSLLNTYMYTHKQKKDPP